MGGHPGGEIAASVVAGVVPTSFTGQSVDELEAAIRASNWVIRDRTVAQPGLEGIGTTICAVGLLTNGQLALFNIGDSRAHLWHGSARNLRTRDHSVTAELIARGELRHEEAAKHPITVFSRVRSASGRMSRSTAELLPSTKETESSFAMMDSSTSCPPRISLAPRREVRTWPQSLTT